MSARTAWLAVLAPGLVVGVPALVLIAITGFDGLYGQDSYAYVDYALGPLSQFVRNAALPPDFFWPPGFPLVVALANLSSGLGVAAAQIVSLAAGTLAAILVALLARELLLHRALPPSRPSSVNAIALLSGLAFALCGQVWQSSVVVMSDTTAVALATTGALGVARYARTGRAAWLLLAAGATTFAIETRWIYGLVALPIASIALVRLAQLARQRMALAAGHAIAASVVTLLVASPTLLPIGRALLDGSAVPFVGDFVVYHWDPGGALRSTFDTPDGRLAFAMPTGLFYLAQPFQHYWFAVLGVFSIPGVVSVARQATPAGVALLLVWPALVLAFLVGGAYQNTRFFLAAAPPVAVLIGFGSLSVWALIAGRVPAAQRLVAGLIILALLLNATLAARFAYSFIDRVSADAAAVRSLAAQVPDGARLISLGATALLRHDGVAVLELAHLDGGSVTQLLAEEGPTYMLVDWSSITSQWAASDVGLTIRVAQDVANMRVVGAAGIWSLFELADL